MEAVKIPTKFISILIVSPIFVCARARTCAHVCVCVLDLRFSKKCVLKSFSMIVDLPISYVFLLLFV